ncbi:histone H1B-like [Aedes aegypti]|uniref:Uncharacterized protein n=1 Tax=Aedes aegypti TaxID=7159 RepID=A0A6I8U202_AEDAE|nr:histone H1B-like [Aedes aegypti]
MSEVALKPLPAAPGCLASQDQEAKGPQGTGQAEEAVDPPPSQRHGCCCIKTLKERKRIVPAGHQENGVEKGQVRPNQGHRRFRSFKLKAEAKKAASEKKPKKAGEKKAKKATGEKKKATKNQLGRRRPRSQPARRKPRSRLQPRKPKLLVPRLPKRPVV